MAERASVFEGIQLGSEATPGTAVAANKRLYSTSIELQPKEPFDTIRPKGFKVPTDLNKRKGWTEGDISGNLAFNDLVYLLASCVCKPYVSAGASSSIWIFRPNTFGPDLFQTYTVEQGSSAGAARTTHGTVTSMDLKFTEASLDVSGKLVGKLLDEAGVTMTATPTDVAMVPAATPDVDVFIHDTVAGLADNANKLPRCLESSLTLPERKSLLFSQDSTEPSFAALVEKAFEPMAQLILEQDSNAIPYMAAMRLRSKKYGRIRISGPLIAGAAYYRADIRFPFKFKDTNRADKNDVFAGTYDLQLLHDPSFLTGAALDIQVETGLTLAASGVAGTAGTI